MWAAMKLDVQHPEAMSQEQRRQLEQLYKEFQQLYPKSDCARRIPLDYKVSAAVRAGQPQQDSWG